MTTFSWQWTNHKYWKQQYLCCIEFLVRHFTRERGRTFFTTNLNYLPQLLIPDLKLVLLLLCLLPVILSPFEGSDVTLIFVVSIIRTRITYIIIIIICWYIESSTRWYIHPSNCWYIESPYVIYMDTGVQSWRKQQIWRLKNSWVHTFEGVLWNLFRICFQCILYLILPLSWIRVTFVTFIDNWLRMIFSPWIVKELVILCDIIISVDQTWCDETTVISSQ